MSDEIKLKTCPYCAEQIEADLTTCKYCGEWLGETTTHKSEQTDSQSQVNEPNLIIKLLEAKACLFADLVVTVDDDTYELKNGGILRLNVSRGLHKISCKSNTKAFQRKSEIMVTVDDHSVVCIKYDRATGALRMREGEIKKDNLMCILGFILSLTGVILPFFNIFGIILSIIGLCQFDSTEEEGKGYGIAGLIIGVLSFIISIFFFILILAMAE